MKALRFVDKHLEELIASIFLAAMTIVIALQIIFRFTGAPLSWTEELARYMFIWLIYISCSYAVRTRSHIKVDMLTLFFKKRGNLVLSLLSDLAFLIFSVIITYYGTIVVHKLAVVNPQYSAAMNMPMWIPYLSFALGMGLASIRLVQDMVLLCVEYKQNKEEK